MWGPWQERLQEKFQTLTGKAHCVTFNSATAALEVLLRWLGPKTTRLRVAFQANTFPSPVFAAERAGWHVGFADIDTETLAPGLPDLDALYDRWPFAAFVVQWSGGFISKDARSLKAWCNNRDVVLIEDASHAAGSMLNDVYAGGIGHHAVFSLAATKPLHTGQGGVLLTDDTGLSTYAFRMKNYGRTEMFQRGQYVERGFNSHLTEMQAAIGTVLFDSMERRIEERTALTQVYKDRLGQFEGLRFLGTWEDAWPNLYKVPVWLPGHVSREALKTRLAAQDIELGSAIYEFVTPHLVVFAGQYAARPFPKTEAYAEQHICLPMHNALTREDVERVAAAVVEWLAQKPDTMV